MKYKIECLYLYALYFSNAIIFILDILILHVKFDLDWPLGLLCNRIINCLPIISIMMHNININNHKINNKSPNHKAKM